MSEFRTVWRMVGEVRVARRSRCPAHLNKSPRGHNDLVRHALLLLALTVSLTGALILQAVTGSAVLAGTAAAITVTVCVVGLTRGG